MDKLDETLKGLEYCVHQDPAIDNCSECPGDNCHVCTALELLKAQRNRIKELEELLYKGGCDGLNVCSVMSCPYYNASHVRFEETKAAIIVGLQTENEKLKAKIRELENDTSPMVMTLEELLDKQEFSEDTRPVWFEYVHGNVKAVVLLYTEYREDEDTVTMIGTGAYVHESWIQGEYGKTWRCWTSKPTDEQRKTVKWDD